MRLALLLLAGCAAPVQVPGAVPAWPDWPGEIQSALAEYPHGKCDPGRLDWVRLPDEEYQHLCEVFPAPAGQIACYLPGQETIVLSRFAGPRTVVHETLHWLDDCSGQFDWDDPHGDPLVWGPGGALERALQ